MKIGGKHRYIGFCLSKIQENIPNDFFHAVVKRAHEYGYKVLIFHTFTDLYNNDKYDEGERKIFDLIPYELLDGLIVMGETIKNADVLDGIIANARRHGVYTVCVDKRIDGCYNVEFNYRSAFEAIVRHMVDKHNCRTVNIVAGFKDNPFSDERIRCCRRILEEHGLKLDPERIMYGDFWSAPTERAMDEFMQKGLPLPDVFICCNDAMAITVCAKLAEYGYKVPDDVYVTGFDGIVEERYHIPRLTTARQDVELAGERSVDAIISHINGRHSDNFCVIDHKVVMSHSCGCKPIDYREATGKITPLFKLADEDNSFDTSMFEFSSDTAAVNGIEELSEKIIKHNNAYGYYYFAVDLNDDFMNISDDYEDFILSQNRAENSENRLILCESLHNHRYPPYFGSRSVRYEEALDSYNVFFHWPIHFQEMNIGFGVTALSTGADGLYPNDDIRHLIKYTRNLNHVLEIANSQSVMKKVIAKLQDLYIRDHTGLYNRRGFYSEIQHYMSDALQNATEAFNLIIISADMDGLKYINDTYGHAEGDVAIKAFASALIAVWDANSICSRFGGDEFIVAHICQSDPETTGNAIVNKIKEGLEGFNSTSGKPYTVVGSYGVKWETITPGLALDTVIKDADDLMYREKSTHKRSRYRSAEQKQDP